MGFFDTTRGKISLGLLLASGGGLLAMNLMERYEDNAQVVQAVTMGLIFWIVFVGKTTIQAVKGELGLEPGQAEVAMVVAAPIGAAAASRQQRSSKGHAKGAAKKASPVPAESEEEDAGPARRRRSRRD